MWNEHSSHRVFIAILIASVGIHAGVVATLPAGEAAAALPAPPSAPVTMTFTVATPPPPAVAAAVAPRESVSIPARVPAARRIAPKPRPSQTAASATPAPSPTAAAPEVADFTGVTLTAGTGTFSTATGDGSMLTGPLVVTPRAASHGAGRRGSEGPEVVGLADLSRAPRAPALDAALERNYPSWARESGTAGTAVVRVRILPSGRVDQARVLTASGDGFGEACRRTLIGSTWQPPLDMDARPVATEISYTCRFEVSR